MQFAKLRYRLLKKNSDLKIPIKCQSFYSWLTHWSLVFIDHVDVASHPANSPGSLQKQTLINPGTIPPLHQQLEDLKIPLSMAFRIVERAIIEKHSVALKRFLIWCRSFEPGDPRSELQHPGIIIAFLTFIFAVRKSIMTEFNRDGDVMRLTHRQSNFYSITKSWWNKMHRTKGAGNIIVFLLFSILSDRCWSFAEKK